MQGTAGLDPAAIGLLDRLYRDAGACLIVLPNRSLYPRAAFFDTPYHLQEPMQRAHSRLLAPRLAQVMRHGCPAPPAARAKLPL